MKTTFVIVLSIVGMIGVTAAALATAHIAINPVEPISAALIGGASAALGIIPLSRAPRRDLVAVMQMAMAGTVIHLVTQVALIAGMFFTHTIGIHASALGWLVGQYWVSLIALIWQLRRMILESAPAAKAGE